MSHNILKVNNKKPDNQGNIPINLENYTNLDSTSTDNILMYNGSNWINGSNSTFPVDLISGFNYRNSTYGTGGYYYSVGNYLVNRHNTDRANRYSSNSSFVTMTAANTSVTSNNSSWFEAVKITNAGTYLCMYSVGCSSGNSISYRWKDHNGNYFSNTSTVQSSNNAWGAICTGIVTTSGSNEIIKVVCTAVSGLVNINQDEEAYASSMTIMKLG